MKLWILTIVSLWILAVSLILLSWGVFQNLKEPIGIIAVVALLVTSAGAVALLIRRAWQYWLATEKNRGQLLIWSLFPVFMITFCLGVAMLFGYIPSLPTPEGGWLSQGWIIIIASTIGMLALRMVAWVDQRFHPARGG